MSLQVNDPVHIDVIENGFWKDSCKGRIVRETEKFWIVESSSHHFWNSRDGEFVARRFAKSAGRLSKRA